MFPVLRLEGPPLGLSHNPLNKQKNAKFVHTIDIVLICAILCSSSSRFFYLFHFLQVFDSDGEFLFTFGSHGEGNGQFNAPTGIAVDENDNIIVADWGNCRIQVRERVAI